VALRADVSCVIPVRDGERYLAGAIESALAQSLPLREVIVVDDGSTDCSVEVAREFGVRVRCVQQDPAGPGTARNRGLALAGGALIAFLDADDLWLPQKIALQAARFEARPELDLCFGHAVNFWSEDVPPERRDGGAALLASWPGRSCITLMTRRSTFDNVGGFDPELAFGEDLDWFQRAEDAGCISEVLPDVLARRRLHERNLSRLRPEESREAVLRAARDLIARRRAAARDETRP